MISIDTHDRRRPMTLPAACEWLGRQTGKVPATSTMWRWCLKGVRGGVRLESFRIGGTSYTTPEMIERFIAATSHSPVTVEVSPAGVSVSAGDTRDARAEQIAVAQARFKDICAPKRRSHGRRLTRS